MFVKFVELFWKLFRRTYFGLDLKDFQCPSNDYFDSVYQLLVLIHRLNNTKTYDLARCTETADIIYMYVNIRLVLGIFENNKRLTTLMAVTKSSSYHCVQRFD